MDIKTFLERKSTEELEMWRERIMEDIETIISNEGANTPPHDHAIAALIMVNEELNSRLPMVRH